MDQTINTGDYIGKGAKGSQTNDLSIHNGAHRIIALENLPRVVLQLLEAKRDLLVLVIQLLDGHLYGVANLNHLTGVLNAVPTQLADMNHTVNTADIYERAVAGQGLHGTGQLLTLGQGCPQSLLLGFLLLIGYHLNGANGTAASRVQVNNLEANGCALEHIQFLPTGYAGKRSGHKHTGALGGYQNTALYDSNNGAFQHFIVLMRCNDFVPAFECVHQLLGKLQNALFIGCFHDDEVQYIADFDNILCFIHRLCGKISQRDHTGLLSAGHINEYLGGCDVYNSALYDLAVIIFAKGFFQHFCE